jgi:dCMP deaminase
MPTQAALDKTYMECAKAHSLLSKAVRKKVGACLVTKEGIIIPGYNGTPKGTDNTCEDEKVTYNYVGSGTINPFEKTSVLVTKPTVIHAELNCILKAAQLGVSVTGSTLYLTMMPCLPCAAFLVQVGISRVIYLEDYRDSSGIFFLHNAGVLINRYSGD